MSDCENCKKHEGHIAWLRETIEMQDKTIVNIRSGLLDKFAMTALTGMLSRPYPTIVDEKQLESQSDMAIGAYLYADAMMKEREKYINPQVAQDQ